MTERSQILVEGIIFALQKTGGISRYATELLNGLQRVMSESGLIPVLGRFDKSESNNTLKGLHPQIESVRLKIPGVFLSPLNASAFSSPKLGIVHSPYLYLPKRTSWRANILTFHDFIFLDEKKTLRGEIRKFIMDRSFHRADGLLSGSYAAVKDFYQLYPSMEKKPISVIYHGLSRKFSEEAQKELQVARENFLLYIGPRNGYKSFWPFLETFMNSRYKKDFKICCVGGGEFTDEEKSRLHALKVDRQFEHKPYVTEESLTDLYCRAAALVYPSEREGFGFPIIEAFACGCPVITRKASSMAEIGKELPCYIEAMDVENLEAALTPVLTQSYNSLAYKAYARDFTWERSVKEHIKFYKSFL